MAKLDSLIVDLQLNTAELRKGLDEANTKLDGFGKKMAELSGVVTFAIIGDMALQAAKKLGQFVLHGAETADKMGEMSQAAGVSVEEFSRLNYAASLSGVSTETLGTALKKLNNNLSEASTGSSKQVALFQALGVAVKDSSGHVRSAGDVMRDLAGVFGGMKDGASKAKLELELFGKSGVDMTAMMNLGKAGLKGLSEEADRLGITLSSSGVEALSGFMDNLDKLKAVSTSVAQRVAIELAPALEALTTQLLNNKDGVDGLKGSVEFLSNLLRVLASGAVIVAAVFQTVGTSISAAASAAADFASGRSSAELTGKDRMLALVDLAKARAELTAAQREASDVATGGSGSINSSNIAGLVENVDAAQKKVDGLVEALGGLDAPAPAEQESLTAPLEVALDRIKAIWTATAEESKRSAEVQKTSGDEIAKAFADATEGIEKQKKALESLAEMALKAERELTKMALAQDATRERGVASMAASNEDRTTAFNNIGPASFAHTMKVIDSATRGFADFQGALAELASSTARAAQFHDAAALETKRASDAAAAATKALAAGLDKQAAELDAVANAATDNAQELNLAADEASRAAGKADKAANAFGTLAETVIQRQQQIVAMAIGVVSSIGEKGAEVGQLISSAMEGFKAGGVIGAVVAVIANLFAKLASVGQFLDAAFGKFMDAFQQLDEGFSVLFSALTESLGPVMRGLSMTFGLISKVLTPIFTLLETIMKPFEDLANGVMNLIDATGILDFVIKAVTTVFNVVGLVIGGIILGLQYVWMGILKAVRAIIWLFTAGQGTKEIDKTIEEHAAAIEANKANLARSANSLDQPQTTKEPKTPEAGAPPSMGGSAAAAEFDAVWARNEQRTKDAEAAAYTAYSDAIAAGAGFVAAEEAGAEAKRRYLELNPVLAVAVPEVEGLGDAAANAAATVNAFSQSLTNVPQGFKYAARAFEATSGGRSMLAGRAGSEAGGNTTIHVHGSVISENELVSIVTEGQNRRQFRRGGVSMTANLR